MKRIKLQLFVHILMISVVAYVHVSAQDLCKPVGWVTQNGGVTGGGNTSATVVSDYGALKSALTSATVKVVHISGKITIPAGGRLTIQDQTGKTIIGLAGSRMISSDMSKDGSGIMYIKRSKNFIMRNLVFEGPGAYDNDGYDNLCIDDCQNFWVDHCEFHDGMDGNFDIKNKSDFISVTWCTFGYEKPPKAGGSGGSGDHRYSNLIGSSDNANGDEGHLNVTFYYCWWAEGCRERMPRMRFGKLHMVNCLFSSSVSNNCIRAGYKADVHAVGNYFDKQKVPIDEYDGDYTAIRAYNNYGASDITKKTAFTPPYTITVANPSTIVTPVKSCAGAKLTSPGGCSSCGGPVNESPTVTITAPANNAVLVTTASIVISANASDKDGTISKVEFFDGTGLLGSDNSSPFSFTWTDAGHGAHTVTAKATDNSGAVTISSPVTITVTDPSLPSLVVSAASQSVDSGKEITPIVFTWGGAATDVKYNELPQGLSASKNSTAKTLTITGKPLKEGSISVTTEGGTPAVTLSSSISIKIAGSILADWYTFQQSTVTLNFVKFTNGKVEPEYFDESKSDNGVSYSRGALRLNKGTGSMTLTLRSLEELKIRFYATGGRSLKVSYGPNGTEKTWNSPSEYESGAHELNLTSTIPELVSSVPVTIVIVNNRTDGGVLSIHDLYVKGTELPLTPVVDLRHTKSSVNEQITVVKRGSTLQLSNTIAKFAKEQPVYILNLLGKTVHNQKISESIDISKLENGVYVLRAGMYSITFVKR
ncbi:MAG: hypothetical protein JW915_02155 [Chitinispirillaceae bacterium]|nr:hypothetical protein [Chitinispirillaceae bacterium]